ncbi:site-specific integrase [Vaginella massiliensis]|uniref:site-specific integrase n=1 Tax=Vaginella massiliensis TaxID=1816680 RepID=UPI000838A2CE|nr:site-specific integrase [Vaginella massiliensis]
MLIKYHAQFLLDKEVDNPTAKLRYRIKWNNNKRIVSFSVGYRVEIDKWSLETQRCKTNTTHGPKKVPASEINKRLNLFEKACENLFNNYQTKNVIPEIQDFKQQFNRCIGRDKANVEESFYKIYDLFLNEETEINQWSSRTYQKYKTLKAHLYNFNQNLKFSECTKETLYGFVFYLQGIKHKNTTIVKTIALFKIFLKWSYKKEYLKIEDFKFFQPKLTQYKKKIIFLSSNELIQLRDYIIPSDKKHLEKVRDVFLFQCYTGLRYSDVENLKKTDVKESHIEITTLKTADSLIIELNKHSRSILEKYANQTFDSNKALPVIRNQTMNDHLKELAKLAGINEIIRETYYIGKKRIDEVYPKYALLGTHAGRRTFICNALALGIPPQVIMKWTGHSDYKAMKPYIDIATEIKANEMSKFNNIF